MIRRAVLNEVVAVLNGATKPPGIPTARARRSLPEAAIREPEINVYFASEDVTVKGGRFGPVYQKDVRIVVECRAVTTEADEIDTILDPYLEWVEKSINSSNNLNNKAIDVVELGTTWTPYFLDKFFPVCRTSFLVSYTTNRKNPGAAA